ncbi:adenosine 5'-monophosphoramidase HINT3 isoform X1 [Myxocyprinus asiaticus]|uniref:adenosine 5'-monophosphoramidase HINT3 isoform X1 n=1 Tax=Myxocyprinus asiaticus TaxID=70543 RepID=UPI002221EBD4|nr:adenosine 5'-monophosphoramidase HINT3 isoform X1 [Myxocyprinus asiaticus]
MTEEKCSEENKRYSSNDSSDSDCTFCLIARGDHPHTHILVDDKDIVCFQDINPGALHHYLVVPKKHIHSCLSFKADDISLVRRMAEIGKAVLKAKNVTDFEDISLGFHVPPYITVPHLHLHVLAPFSQLHIETRFKYTDYWYLTVEKLLKILDDLEKTKDGSLKTDNDYL